MDASRANTYRKLLLPVIAIVIVVIAFFLVYNFFIRARITVTAPVGSTITVSRVLDGKQVATEKSTGTTTTVALSPANYAVVVDNGGTGKQLFYTTTRTFQDTKITFDAPSELPATTVAKRTAYDVILQGNAISYLDTTRRTIAHIDSNGSTSALDNTAPLNSFTSDNPGTAQGIYPIADNEAIVLTGGKLYVVQNSQLTPLNMTGLPDTSSPIMVGANVGQTSFVIAINQTIYYYDSPSSTPQKVLSLDKRFDHVAYGGNNAVIYSTRMPLTTDNIRSAYNAYAIDPIIIDVTNKTQKVLTHGPIVDASLSPDGQYATIEPQSDPYTIIYNISQGTPLYTIISPDTTTPSWLDNTHFVYGKGSDVWKFDVASRSGLAIGTVPDSQQPTSITYNPGNNRYYVTTYPSEDTSTIFSLSSASPEPNAEKAAGLDTASQDNNLFTLDYVNILQPTVRVLTNVISNNPSPATFKTLTLQSRQAALEYIKSKGVDPTKLTVVYDPAL